MLHITGCKLLSQCKTSKLRKEHERKKKNLGIIRRKMCAASERKSSDKINDTSFMCCKDARTNFVPALHVPVSL